MRVVIFLGLLFGLFFAEAAYQRRLHRMKEFEASLETLRASLGELQLTGVALSSAYGRFATAARRVAEEARRRGQP